jgi:8-oxo-dGTP pyrophosphatase MutT (NUDIX family)/predicted transcriptional regulator
MINTQNESSLHFQLKNWYKQTGDELEKEVDGYIIDLVRNDRLIEIQTANFASLKKKLRKLIFSHKITLVYPVAQTKWILQLDAEHQLVSRRRSPRRGRPVDIFYELVSLPQLITHPNFSLEILLCEIEEIRIDDGKGSYRRQGKSIADRKLLQVNEQLRFDNAVQILEMFLSDLPEPISSRSLAKEFKISRSSAQKMAYALRKMGVIRQIGKRGGTYLYSKIKTEFAKHDHYNRLLDRPPAHPLVIGKDNYYHSVVFVPFVEIENEQYLLFQKRSDSIRQPGEVCFPGGGVDRFKDKDIEATAVRETREELGIPRAKIEVGGYMGAIINPLGAFVDVIAGKLHISDISELELNRKEVERVFLVPVHFFQEKEPEEYRLDYKLHSIVHNEEGEELELFPARKLGLPQKYWHTWSGKHRRIFVYKFEENIIWGLTAEIVRAVMNLISLQGV